MQKLFFFLLFPACVLSLSARDNPHWLRYCAISPDGAVIAFTYKGQIYTVPVRGGVARQLTKDTAYHFMPVWSHDGRRIAFAGSRYGNFDVFIMSAAGGELKRLTVHSADEYPYDFTEDDSSVLFGAVRLDAPANRQYPSDALQELYRVPSRGGRVEQVLTTPAEDAHVSPSGRLMVYHDRKGRENPWRKHQTSSIARDIWLFDPATGVHTKVTSFNGEDRDAVFASDTSIYYLSEAGGNFNVYQLGLNGPSVPRQVTFFPKEPLRSLSISRDGTLCFGYDGEIWCKRRNGDPFKVRVIVRQRPDEKAEATVPMGDAGEMAVAPNGKAVAFICHGEVFVSDTEGRSVRRITRTSGVEAGLSFSPDGHRLLYAGERDGRWKIYVADMDTAGPLKDSVVIGNGHENYQPQFSPDGKEIAYIEDRTTLKVYNIATGVSRTILRDKLYSRRDNDQYFKWSPDGKWLLLQFSEPGGGNDEAGIVSTDGKGRLINLTNSGFNDSQPRWVMGGKAILWLSDRNGLRSYAGSGTRQKDIYVLCLTPEVWDVLRGIDSTIKGTTVRIAGSGGIDSEGRGKGEAPAGKGYGPWEARRIRLTSQSMLLADALLSADGKMLYYLARSDKGYDLWQMDLRSHTSRVLAPLAAGDAFMEGGDEGRDIFICADGHIVAVDPATARCRHVYTKGEMTLHPAAERRSMFEHVWRRVDETFYAAGLHGVDWKGCKTTYERYLPDIDNNYDLSEMLNEMLGELNVSHTGATYRPAGKGKDVTASLGAFYDQSYRDTGMRIAEVMQDGPLNDPLLGIVPGTIIEAVDGEPVSPDRDLAGYLNHKAGKNTTLTIRNGGDRRTIVVRPITPEEENELLYQRWVNRNRAETDSLSHGQLGYVHLPRMNDAAYRNVYEEALGRYAGRKGIVVDTRFNRGGDLAPELTMFLGGARIRDNVAGPLLVNSEPSFRWTQPSIVLAGEANYSDGSCFVYDYAYLHMGKLVGMPIPGSCTFQTGQSLQDNTLQWSCPTLGVKDLQGAYLEGRQTEPDVRVMNEYDKVAAGRDQQLETAIQVLLKDLR
ncbi:MAG TPA: S41 family peptidase [Puia sp.]|nr:S41 family peptidase [Puia sp.]